MSSASTQFEDERRLEFMIAKNHRDAQRRAQIEQARMARPATGHASARVHQMLNTIVTGLRVRLHQERQATTDVTAVQGVRQEIT